MLNLYQRKTLTEFSMKVSIEDLPFLEEFCKNRNIFLDSDDVYYFTDRITTICFLNISLIENKAIFDDVFMGSMTYTEIDFKDFKKAFSEEFKNIQEGE